MSIQILIQAFTNVDVHSHLVIYFVYNQLCSFESPATSTSTFGPVWPPPPPSITKFGWLPPLHDVLSILSVEEPILKCREVYNQPNLFIHNYLFIILWMCKSVLFYYCKVKVISINISNLIFLWIYYVFYLPFNLLRINSQKIVWKLKNKYKE